MKALSTLRTVAVPLMAGLFAWLAPAGARAQTMPIQNLRHFPRTVLIVQAPGHPCRFKVWIANSRARQAQGLMFVRDLPADEGMLFPMHPVRVARFWMANTYIPLDMLFVAPDGRIEKITARATPFSLKTISSGAPVEAVIEIAGGEAKKLGLKVGQRVSWKHTAGVDAGH